MRIYLDDVPTEKDGSIFFTLRIRGQVQRYALTHEALTELARVGDITPAEKLALFETHRERIFHVAERWLGPPTGSTIHLLTGFFQ